MFDFIPQLVFAMLFQVSGIMLLFISVYLTLGFFVKLAQVIKSGRYDDVAGATMMAAIVDTMSLYVHCIM